MRKCQTGILGVVILTGIVLAIISVTYVWGQPLIQKNVDRAQVNQALEKIEEINDAILYTSSTGSNSIVNLDLTKSTFLVDADNNRVVIETTSTVPIVASVEEVPINYYELAEKRESITYNTTNTINTDPIISGYEVTTHHANTTIQEVNYNVSIHENTSTNEWDLLCIWKDYTINKNNDCAGAQEALEKEGVTIDVLSILASGEAAYALGGMEENKGILGSEPSGIVSAESINLGDSEKITFYLTYRSMLSSEDEEYKVILNCNQDCVASNTDKKLVISRENVIITTSEVNTIINLEVQ